MRFTGGRLSHNSGIVRRLTPGITRRPERFTVDDIIRVGGRVHAVVRRGVILKLQCKPSQSRSEFTKLLASLSEPPDTLPSSSLDDPYNLQELNVKLARRIRRASSYEIYVTGF